MARFGPEMTGELFHLILSYFDAQNDKRSTLSLVYNSLLLLKSHLSGTVRLVEMSFGLIASPVYLKKVIFIRP